MGYESKGQAPVKWATVYPDRKVKVWCTAKQAQRDQEQALRDGIHAAVAPLYLGQTYTGGDPRPMETPSIVGKLDQIGDIDLPPDGRSQVLIEVDREDARRLARHLYAPVRVVVGDTESDTEAHPYPDALIARLEAVARDANPMSEFVTIRVGDIHRAIEQIKLTAGTSEEDPS